MSDFIKNAHASQISEDGKIYLEIAERFVVLIRAGGDFYCIDDVCTHDGGPLGEGELEGFELACPRHGAKFDIRSSEALTMPATEPTTVHKVKMEGDDIFVKIDD